MRIKGDEKKNKTNKKTNKEGRGSRRALISALIIGHYWDPGCYPVDPFKRVPRGEISSRNRPLARSPPPRYPATRFRSARSRGISGRRSHHGEIRCRPREEAKEPARRPQTLRFVGTARLDASRQGKRAARECVRRAVLSFSDTFFHWAPLRGCRCGQPSCHRRAIPGTRPFALRAREKARNPRRAKAVNDEKAFRRSAERGPTIFFRRSLRAKIKRNTNWPLFTMSPILRKMIDAPRRANKSLRKPEGGIALNYY